MSAVSQVVRDLLSNGVHFGHQVSKWNPKMKKFMFGKKSGICIIDLEKTEKALKAASDFLFDLSRQGKKAIFVGTKKQAKTIIKEQAERCGMYYVDERWLGGCLTNFETILKSVDRLEKIQATKECDLFMTFPKKERVKMEKDEQKLLKNFRGIKDMKKVPDVVIVVDSDAEKIAVLEARKLNIPVVALLDTNCDPDMVEFPIPANDDAIRSIKYICSTLADAIVKGCMEYDGGKSIKQEEPVPAEPVKVEEAPAAEEVAVKEEETKKEAPAGQAAEVSSEEEETPAEEETEEAPAEQEEEKKEDMEGDISLG